MTRVAVLGTGRMGGAIAHRLVASGFDLQVWDRTAAKASALNVGRVAQTPAEALRDADIVISSLTNAAAVHDVYLGPQGAFGTSTTALFVEMSTAGPESIDELSREARTRGLRLLEAPVLGSVPAVESGTLAVLVGGSRDDLEAARPVLERLGEIHHVGGFGSAARLKLVANTMLAITSAAAAELLAAGTAAGLDREQVFWALVRFAPALKAREAGFMRDQHTPTMFAVHDLVKDLGLALEVFERTNAAVPLTREARSLFAETASESSDLDISAIVNAYSGGSRAPQNVASLRQAR
ncbi:MAG: NAD(P)-dependent oxidoreductase [Chloroflexi bacterium]|nr:MAG: NAD(P)-dependent oxidoreductase [Chloroflexota bacterium]TME72791.1 MAG: NAD(P)-dependent oxidoreductase [Chloroflexota bacterium]TMG54338.1 MAG: NAD(P)-dependent oxidoreductase [Chloroflexota bacterium]